LQLIDYGNGYVNEKMQREQKDSKKKDCRTKC
jgi:hypothetical protein